MRVAIIGAGIVGVTTAYELAAEGHEVTVFERRSAVAEGTSFANAGVLAPGYVTPWAAPGMPAKVLRQLLSRHAAIRLPGAGWLGQLPWLWRWWRACAAKPYAANRSAMQALARRSREHQRELSRRLQLDYEQQDGYLVLLRSQRELDAARPGLALLQELGVAHRLVDAEEARRIEPGLNPATALAAAIHLHDDGVGNCRQFAQLMKVQAQRLGVFFRFDTTVQRLVPGLQPRLEVARGHAAGDTELLAPEALDAVVVCAGVESAALLAPLRLRLPLAPVYGYSVTAPLRHFEAHPDAAPRSALMDERYKVAISRLGQRIRVAGSAEIGGRSEHFHPAAMQTLYQVLDDWFPGVSQLAQAQRWKGARPMLPDGPPLIGASGLPGIWLNLGHGSSGWALACGSAQVLAAQLAGRDPGLDVTRLSIERLR